jgi:hypothetical protein
MQRLSRTTVITPSMGQWSAAAIPKAAQRRPLTWQASSAPEIGRVSPTAGVYSEHNVPAHRRAESSTYASEPIPRAPVGFT